MPLILAKHSLYQNFLILQHRGYRAERHLDFEAIFKKAIFMQFKKWRSKNPYDFEVRAISKKQRFTTTTKNF